jgi:nitrate/nitrite-specific signal transduction histidine kinase
MGQPGLTGTGTLATHHEILVRSMVELTNTVDLWKFITETISFCATALHCEAVSLFLFDEAIAELRLAFRMENGFPIDLLQSPQLCELLRPFPADQLEIWKEISQRKRPCWQRITCHSGGPQPRLLSLFRSLETSVLGIPLVLHGKMIGVIWFSFAENEEPGKAQPDLINDLAGQIALAIQFLRINTLGNDLKSVRQDMVALKQVHEQLAQYLATISLYLAAADSQVTKQPAIVTDALRKAQELCQHGLRLARDADPASRFGRGDWENLSAALRAITHDAEEDLGSDIGFMEFGRPCEFVPSDVTKALAGIAREAIGNGIRHGRASRIVVTLGWQVEKLLVHIADNGVGFDSTKSDHADAGYGISGMRDQAHRIGGQVEVKSAPGQGTEIHCIVPIMNL